METQVEIAVLRAELENVRHEVQALRTDIQDLLEAWRAASGVVKIIKWVASIAVAIGVLTASLKGIVIHGK